MATATSTQPMAPVKHRPVGVTILGALSILVGIGVFLAGIVFLLIALGIGVSSIFTGFTGTGLGYLGWGVIFLIFGIVSLAVGVGLLRLRMWGLALGAIIYIVFAGIQLIPYAYGDVPSTYQWVIFGFFLFLFLYLLAVRKNFT